MSKYRPSDRDLTPTTPLDVFPRSRSFRFSLWAPLREPTWAARRIANMSTSYRRRIATLWCNANWKYHPQSSKRRSHSSLSSYILKNYGRRTLCHRNWTNYRRTSRRASQPSHRSSAYLAKRPYNTRSKVAKFYRPRSQSSCGCFPNGSGWWYRTLYSPTGASYRR